MVNSANRTALAWQYWARAFGCSADTLCSTHQGWEWVVEQVRMESDPESCAVPPELSLIRDPATGVVYETEGFRSEWLNVPPHSPEFQLAALQTALNKKDMGTMLHGRFCVTGSKQYSRPINVSPLGRASRKSIPKQQLSSGSPVQTIGQWVRDSGIWHKVYESVQPVPGRAPQIEAVPYGLYTQYAARQMMQAHSVSHSPSSHIGRSPAVTQCRRRPTVSMRCTRVTVFRHCDHSPSFCGRH